MDKVAQPTLLASKGGTNDKLIAALSDYVPHVLKYYNTPGLNLAIAHHGEVIWEAGFGYADLERKIQMKPDTVFRSGSMGKTYTATAVMQLVERGIIELDDPINKYLTQFEIANPFGERAITIRDLLTHRTGLTPDMAGSELETPQGLAAYIRDIYAKTHFPPYCGARPLWGAKVGEQYQYSNLGIATLGYLVELTNSEKLSFSSYVQRHIIDPLGMTSTQFPEVQDSKHIRADIYRRMSKGYMHFGAMHLPSPTIHFSEYPAGAVVSIPRDHIRVLLAYLNSGRYNNYQLLKPETVKLMLTHQADMGDGGAVGLVWKMYEVGKASYTFGHSGAHMWGWANDCRAFPGSDLAVVVATNHWHMTDDGRRYAECKAIVDFASSWIVNEGRHSCTVGMQKPWAWRVSYVMGLILVDRTNGGLGIASAISPQQVEAMVRGAVVNGGVTYGETLWDADGFRAGIRDMQAVDMDPEAIRSFMSSSKLQVQTQDLNLIYRELQSCGVPIPWQ